MAFSNEFYQSLESALTRLLNNPELPVSDNEKPEVQNYIDVGEYGLALECLVAIILEEKKKLSRDVLGEIEALALKMGIEKTVVSNELLQCTNPEIDS